jgi:hypothetical protein
MNRIKEPFPLGVYWPWEDKRTLGNAEIAKMDRWEYTEKVMSLLRQHSVNIVWVVHMRVEELSKFCAIASKNNIKVIASTDIEEILDDLSPISIDKTVKKLVSRWKDIDALIGYVGLDEPKGMEMGISNLMMEAFRRHDTSRFFTVVCRHHEIALGMRNLEAEQLCVDPYPFFHEEAPWYEDNSQEAAAIRHVNRLETAAYLKNKFKKRCWFMPQAFAEYSGDFHYDEVNDVIIVEPGGFVNWRMPTETETAWLIWSAIARGFNGLFQFVLLPATIPTTKEFTDSHGENHVTTQTEWLRQMSNVSKPRLVERETALIWRALEPSKQMLKMGEIYAKLAPFAQELASMREIHPLAFVEKPFHARTFTNDAGIFFTIIVNENLANELETTPRLLNCVRKVEEMTTGSALNFAQSTEHPDLNEIDKISIPPGEGIVLRLEADEFSHACFFENSFDTVESSDQPLGEKTNLKATCPLDGSEVPALTLMDDTKRGLLSIDFTTTFAKLAPKNHIGNIYLQLEADGEVEVLISTDSLNNEIVLSENANLPVRLPDEIEKATISLSSPNSRLKTVRLIHVNRRAE